MEYIALPQKTHIHTTTEPVDKECLWVLSEPSETIKIDTEVSHVSDGLDAADYPFVVTNPEVHTVYGFNVVPTVKYYSASTSCWEQVSNETVSSWILPYVNSMGAVVVRQAYQTSKTNRILEVR